MKTTTLRQRLLWPVLLGGVALPLSVFLGRAVAPALGLGAGAAAVLVMIGRLAFRVEGTSRAGTWFTLLGLPLLRLREVELAPLREVVLAREARRGRNGQTVVTYPVWLAGARDVGLWEEATYSAARRLAEGAARAVRRPLRDESFDEPVVRQPAELDLSLGERLRAGGPAPEVPPLPAGSGIRVTRDGDTVLALPGAKPPLLAVALGLGLPLALVLLLLVVVPPPGLLVALPIPLLVLAGFAWAIVAVQRTSTLTIGRDFVESRGHGFRRRIPLARLEEVRRDGDDLLLVSDEVLARLPHTFRSEEASRFVAGLIALAAWHHPAGPLPPFSPGVGVPGEPPEPARSAPGPAQRSGRRARRPPSPLARRWALGMLVPAAVLFAVAAWLAGDTLSFMGRAAAAPGTVIELVRSRGGRGGPVWAPVVRWQPLEGEPRVLRSPISSSPPAYAVGERVEVLFDPGDPAAARIRSFADLWFLTVLTGGIGTVLLVAGAATLARRPRAG